MRWLLRYRVAQYSASARRGRFVYVLLDLGVALTVVMLVLLRAGPLWLIGPLVIADMVSVVVDACAVFTVERYERGLRRSGTAVTTART